MENLWFTAGLVGLAGVLGALLPWTRSWSSEGMHRLVAMSAGIFLGTVVHMWLDLGGTAGHVGHGQLGGLFDSEPFVLPPDARPGAQIEPLGPERSPHTLWIAVVVGCVGLAALERFVLRKRFPHDHGVDGRHALLWRVSLAGLSIHAVFGGLGLAGMYASELWTGALLFMLVHKLVEVFSLSTVLRLANVPTTRAALWLGVFSAITPFAFLFGRSILAVIGPWQDLALGLAVGTFLYVAVFDLLPEAFHRGSWRDRLPYLVFGFVVGGFVPGLTHGHGNAVWDAGLAVFVEMAPYLLAGFLVAGFVSELLRPEFLRRHLAGESVRSVAIASVVGAPLPLCSCSVVPVAAGLRAAGAGRGATSAFLVATPETGVDSVLATWALLGPVMAVVRPIAALVSAMVTGMCVALFGGPAASAATPVEAWDDAPADEEHAEHGCCASEPPPPPPPPAASCCHGEHDESSAPAATTTAATTIAAPLRRPTLVERALRYGYVDVVDDLAWPLVVGVALSGVLGAFLAPEWFESELLQGPLGYLAMLAIGMPIYVCAAASTPIAAVLLAKGLPPGAVLVFLLASPATNLGTMFVVRKLLGTRGLYVHLGALSAVTLVCGFAADVVLAALDIDVVAAASVSTHAHGAGYFGLVAATLLVLVLLASGVRKLASPLQR